MVEEIEIMVEEIEIMVEEIEMVDIILDGEIDQILNLETYLHGHNFLLILLSINKYLIRIIKY